MASFDSDGVTLHFADDGEGDAVVVLIHGFASNREVNWVSTGWVKLLADSGRRVITLDNRGHGKSQKLTDPQAYVTTTMAADVVRLMDHLSLPRATLMGYSMGARIAAFAALAAPERASALILSGLASALVSGVGSSEAVAEALLAPSVDAVTDKNARAFRVFAEQTKSDRRALAACIRAARQTLSEGDVAQIAAPTLVVAGDADPIAGSPEGLARMMPSAEPVILPGKDHMSAVGDRGHKNAVLAFLDRHGI